MRWSIPADYSASAAGPSCSMSARSPAGSSAYHTVLALFGWDGGLSSSIKGNVQVCAIDLT